MRGAGCHEGVVLGEGRAGEDVFDVECDRAGALELGPLRVARGEFADVAVQLHVDRQRQKRCASGADFAGEPGPGHEAHGVATGDEVLRDGQQWRDVSVCG